MTTRADVPPDVQAVPPSGPVTPIRLGPTTWILIGMLAVFVILAIFGPWLTPHDHNQQAPFDRLAPPFTTTERGLHILGTDGLGRDLLSQIIVATRLTLIIGVIATAIGAIVGTLIGAAAGYLGGRVDRLAMRLAEAQTAMPMFLVAILLLSVLGPSIINLIIVLPALVWPTFARIIRAEALRLSSAPFMEAAQALGCSSWMIIRRHLIPNLAGRIGVLVVISVGHVMLAEAGLSFLGVGVQPPDLTWGLLIARGRQYLAVAWWLTIFPGVFLGVMVLVINLIGRRVERDMGAAG